MRYELEPGMLEQFRKFLIEEEKSTATIQKYMRDIQGFFHYIGDCGYVDKEMVIAYKKTLLEKYSIISANSMLVAVNRFLKWAGCYECTVKMFKVQREAFRSPERELTKEEYHRLLRTARSEGKQRLYLLMETIGSTGIRISELRFITVQAVHTGRAAVSLKGKTRTVLLPSQLCRKLKHYIKEKKIYEGSVFVTRTGNPVDRSNILHEMKQLCELAGVERKKIFPHNLRHLFACTYYRLEKNISHLADLLGHSSIDTTRIYTQTSGEEQMRQINLLGLII